MKRLVTCLLFGWALPLNASAQTPDELWYQAQDLFYEGETARSVPLFNAACDAGSEGACFDLYNKSFDEPGLINRGMANAAREKGKRLLSQSCDAGDADACFRLGREFGNDYETDKASAVAAKGIAILSRQCDAGDAYMCFRLADEHAASFDYLSSGPYGLDFDATKVAIAREKGFAIFQAKCDQGDAAMCFELARNIQNLADPQDPVRAAKVRAKGWSIAEDRCDAGDANACFDIADNVVSPSYENGEERGPLTASDYDKVDRFITKAREASYAVCNGGDQDTCTRLGMLELAGIGGPKLASGLSRIETACVSGNIAGCYARLLLTVDVGVEVSRDFRDASAVWDRACAKNGALEICSELDWLDSEGFSYYLEAADAIKGMTLQDAVAECSAGRSHLACKLAAAAYGYEGYSGGGVGSQKFARDAEAISQRLIRRYHELSCEAGDPEGCTEYANGLERGDYGPADPAAARKAIEKACRMAPKKSTQYSIASACDSIGQDLDYALGIEYGSVSVPATPYYRRACKLGQGAACERLDPTYWDTPRADTELPSALTEQERTDLCRIGVAEACAPSVVPPEDIPDPSDWTAARQLLTRACDNSLAEGCYGLAALVFGGKGGPKSPLDAVALLEEACLLGTADACGLGADLIGSNNQGFVPDYSREFSLRERACELDDLLSCALAGRIATSLEGCPARLPAGSACTRDYVRARNYLEKACTGGEPIGCADLGLLYENGRVPDDPVVLGAAAAGIRANYPDAERYYKLACPMSGDKAYPGACNSLGMLYASPGKFNTYSYDPFPEESLKKALPYFERGCALNHATSCLNAGDFYRDGLGTKKNKKKAKALLDQGCRLGNQTACNDLALIK